MSTIEAPVPVVETILEEDDRDDEKTCHLYVHPGNVTMCGIPRSQDWHANAHGKELTLWGKGMLSCPKCEAPICMDCVLTAS